MDKSLTRRLRSCVYVAAKPIAYIAVASLVLSTGYHLYYANRIIPGVTLANIKLGGLTYAQALQAVTSQDSQTTKTLNLWTHNGKSYHITAQDIELSYDWDAGVTRAFEVGRTGNVFVDTKDKLVGLVKPLHLSAKYSYNKDLLGGKVAEMRSEVNIPSVSAKMALTAEGKLEIVPEVYGKSLDETHMYATIRGCLDNLHFAQKTLEVEDSSPQFTKRDLEKVLNATQKVVAREIQLTSGDKVFRLGPPELLKLVSFSPKPEGPELGTDRVELEKVSQGIALELNKLPLGQVVSVQNGRVEEFKIIQNGLEIDKDKFAGDFKRLFFATDGKLSMPIPLKEIKASKNGAEYGIFSLLGTGVSKFTGSAQPRIANLTLAAQRTNGVLVPPGKEYSFNQTVGEISAKTGYAIAYIISQGRTVLGEGGGVCQTSTTLFRAILNAGLPITSRHPHAYRVGYYELESQVGFDASVYQPSLDLKFTNDTPGYVLIQSSADLATNTLEFKLYGTPDGRKVEISEAKLYNVSAPPAALYQDDPTLPKGVVRQVDFSAPGGTAEFTRKVTKGDEVLFEDSYKSVYQPWRAIFLVGTKD
jgi:vancomycin resistance protein YoaR